MPKGNDTRHHPNRKVGRSDLPRLSSLVSSVLNDELEGRYGAGQYGDDQREHVEEQEDFFRNDWRIATDEHRDKVEPLSEVSVDNASDMLKSYRQKRDSGANRQYGAERSISEAFNRRGVHGGFFLGKGYWGKDK